MATAAIRASEKAYRTDQAWTEGFRAAVRPLIRDRVIEVLDAIHQHLVDKAGELADRVMDSEEKITGLDVSVAYEVNRMLVEDVLSDSSESLPEGLEF